MNQIQHTSPDNGLASSVLVSRRCHCQLLDNKCNTFEVIGILITGQVVVANSKCWQMFLFNVMQLVSIAVSLLLKKFACIGER